MIDVRDLTKTFGETDAVQGVSFTVDRGEILGFLGPNGAGKTTTMRMLTCYFPPTSGTAQVDGYDILNQSLEVRKRVGYLPEAVPLYQDMSVDAYLKFVARVKGIPGREEKKRVDEAIDSCALQKVQHRPISNISRGYRQRVGLAQAIVSKPPVLILDEPTVGLDPEQIRDIRALIKELAQNATVILSTHILSEVELLCNRVIIINKGRIRAVDTPQNLTAQLRENAQLEVVVEGSEPGRVVDRLQAVQGVVRVIPDKAETRGQRFKVEVQRARMDDAKQQDVRRELAATVVQADWGLLELRQHDMSLEDIFIQMVREDNTADDQTAEDQTEMAEKADKEA